jgi:hypothetical protein
MTENHWRVFRERISTGVMNSGSARMVPRVATCTPAARALAALVLPIAIALSSWPSPSVAQRRDFFFNADRDLPSLPPACHARLKGTPEERRAWELKLGAEVFMHVHHHCFGIYDINRARMGFDLDVHQKRALYQDAITQFDYVLKHWPQSTPLYKEAELLREQARLALRTLK